MSTVKQTLTANQRHKLPCNGYFFQLLAASAPLSINFLTANSSQPDQHENIPVGFWFESKQPLVYVEIESTISQEIEYLYSNGRTGVDRSETLTVLAQGSAIGDLDSETVGAVRVKVLDINLGRKRVIFAADGANTGVIALGGAGVSLLNAALLLSAGDTWVEDSAAVAEFHAVASAAGQVLRMSEA